MAVAWPLCHRHHKLRPQILRQRSVKLEVLENAYRDRSASTFPSGSEQLGTNRTMSAIFGIVGYAEPEELQRMAERLQHRGPASSIFAASPDVWFGEVQR